MPSPSYLSWGRYPALRQSEEEVGGSGWVVVGVGVGGGVGVGRIEVNVSERATECLEMGVGVNKCVKESMNKVE